MGRTVIDGYNLLFRERELVPGVSLEALREEFLRRVDAARVAGQRVVVVFDGNPTAERIARMIYEHAKEADYPVERVRLWETDTSWAEYEG